MLRRRMLQELTNGDLVVIVDSNQVTELQVTSCGSCFGSDTFHSTAITKEDKGVVVDQLVARFVEDSGSVGLSNGKTDCICKTLAKRTCGHLNTWCVVGLWVTWADAVDCLLHHISTSFLGTAADTYSKPLDIIHRELVAE